jgi:hypothetical protein
MPKRKPAAYGVWYLGPVTKWGEKQKKYSWFCRAETDDWEMAVSLTGDLVMLNVPWQIRDGAGAVVAASDLDSLLQRKILA